jgi:hypothetical protein
MEVKELCLKGKLLNSNSLNGINPGTIVFISPSSGIFPSCGKTSQLSRILRQGAEVQIIESEPTLADIVEATLKIEKAKTKNWKRKQFWER